VHVAPKRDEVLVILTNMSFAKQNNFSERKFFKDSVVKFYYYLFCVDVLLSDITDTMGNFRVTPNHELIVFLGAAGNLHIFSARVISHLLFHSSTVCIYCRLSV
jgi:hypothetical protein